MLIAIALDVLVAYLLTRVLLKWWAWLPATVLAGMAISLGVSITLGLLGFMAAGQSVIHGISNALIHGAITSFAACWLSRRRSPPPIR